ncbi:hypothetical protein [Streptomyces fuscigenes]|uniref:hypothetical protein n=1 Tax=Streptomyces fuscigenes TaxID=1528880 RepID=UPI001F37344B|nr:hypothetical protein [Streptomyces fuscigenes]MCF3960238.1 hypothetical protein [Streptomyces fuscigenes]
MTKSASVKVGKRMALECINSRNALSAMAASANAPTPTSVPTRQIGGEHGTSQVHRRPHPYLPGQRERTIGVWPADGDRLQQPANRGNTVAFLGVACSA